MFGLYEIIAFAVVGLIALLFVDRENVVVKLLASVVFVIGLAPLLLLAAETYFIDQPNTLLSVIVLLLIIVILSLIAYMVSRPSEVRLLN